MRRGLCVLSILCAAAWAQAEGTPPKRVLIIGDSMMRITAHALELELSKQPGVEARSFTSLGSGLARLDIFDWIAKINELVAEFKPDATIVWFGANDRQPMKTNGGVIRPGAPEWDVEYSRRVGEAMDLLAPADGTRVIWLELPNMREPSIQNDVNAINQLVAAETQKRTRVELMPTRTLLGRKVDAYSPYIIGERGMPVQVRDNDGVHLSRPGADLLAAHIAQHLYGGAPAKETP